MVGQTGPEPYLVSVTYQVVVLLVLSRHPDLAIFPAAVFEVETVFFPLALSESCKSSLQVSDSIHPYCLQIHTYLLPLSERTPQGFPCDDPSVLLGQGLEIWLALVYELGDCANLELRVRAMVFEHH